MQRAMLLSLINLLLRKPAVQLQGDPRRLLSENDLWPIHLKFNSLVQSLLILGLQMLFLRNSLVILDSILIRFTH